MRVVAGELFPNEPTAKCRDSKGRFATREKAYTDKAIAENKRLRLEREKYQRAYLAAGEMACHWQRKYMELRQRVDSLLR